MHKQVKQVLGALNLALDILLLTEITSAVQCLHDQRLGDDMSELQVIAVAALVSQNKRLLAVDKNTLVSAGLSIQSFLSRISLQKKDQFLRFVGVFSKKWDLCSNHVKQKVSYLQKAYFFYLNYHRAFIEIAQSMRNGFSPNVAQSISNIFWLAYMQRGRGVKILGQQKEQIKKLKQYLFWIFVDYFRIAESAEMRKILDLQENSIQLAYLQQLNSQVLANLQNVCLSRNFKIDTLNSQILINNTAQLLLYEYAKNFANKYESSDIFQIKYTHFFTFNSTFSPKPKPRVIQNQQVTVHTISQRLQFQDEEESQEDGFYWRLSEEATPSEKHSRQQQQQEIVLPQHQNQKHNELLQIISSSKFQLGVRDRLKALGWVNRHMHVKGHPFRKTVQFFQKILGQDLEQFLSIQQKVVQKFIKALVPACVQVQNKSKRVLSVFQNFLTMILEKNIENQVKSTFESLQNMNGFMFISVLVVGCAYQVNFPKMQLCLKQFGISAEDAFIPINWIGSNTDLPHSLKMYIIEVEKSLLLSQIWTQGKGFQLLQGIKQNKVTYCQKSMMKRLTMHVHNKVSQLCSQDKLLIAKVLSLVELIEKKNVNIFIHNSMDSVILAAYGLVVCKKSLSQAAQGALKVWSNIKYYLSTELCFFDLAGKKITFQSFLKQLSEMMNTRQDLQAVGIRRERNKEDTLYSPFNTGVLQ